MLCNFSTHASLPPPAGAAVVEPFKLPDEPRTVSKTSTTQEVGEWLEATGLGAYREAFEEEKINGLALTALTEADIKESLGVAALGHRRILTTAVQQMTHESTPRHSHVRSRSPSISSRSTTPRGRKRRDGWKADKPLEPFRNRGDCSKLMYLTPSQHTLHAPTHTHT